MRQILVVIFFTFCAISPFVAHAQGQDIAYDTPLGLILLKAKAYAGDAESQYILSTYVPREEAVDWLEKAAEQGHTISMGRLCEMYRGAHGVKRDLKKGIAWCEKAITAKDPTGYFAYAFYYYDGLGVAQDWMKGAALHRQARELGSPHVDMFLRKMHTLCPMKDGQNVKAYACQVLAAQGDVQAQIFVRDMFLRGRWGVQQDAEKADYWTGVLADKSVDHVFTAE